MVRLGCPKTLALFRDYITEITIPESIWIYNDLIMNLLSVFGLKLSPAMCVFSYTGYCVKSTLSLKGKINMYYFPRPLAKNSFTIAGDDLSADLGVPWKIEDPLSRNTTWSAIFNVLGTS